MIGNGKRLICSLAGVVACMSVGVGTANAQPGDCLADCNNDGQLNILDFICFQAQFEAGADEADCNMDGLLNILDFICFQAAFEEGCDTGDPVIEDIFPLEGGPGTLITVLGKNFDQLGADDAEDLCCGAGNIGFQAVKLTPECIQAVVLPFDPDNAKGGEFQIAVGDGDQQLLLDPPEGADVQEPVWCWGQPPNGPVLPGGVEFTPVGGNVGPGKWFGTDLVDGKLVIDLSQVDWQPGDKLRIVARLWCEIRHIDCVLPTVQLQGNPDPIQCAIAICQLIERAYNQLGIEVECEMDPNGPRIILGYPDCPIQPGISLTSGVEVIPCPPNDPVPLQILDVQALDPVLEECDIVIVCLEGGQTPKDFCAQFIGGCPTEPLAFINQYLVLKVGPVPPGAVPGPLLVANGEGTLINPDDFFLPGAEIGEIPQGFVGQAGFPFDDLVDPGFEPGGGSANTTPFIFDTGTGQLIAKLDESWETGDKIRVDVHFDVQNAAGGKTHYDCFADEVCLTTPNPDPEQCATLICLLLEQCFANQGVDIQCDTDGANIIITTPNLGEICGGGGAIKRTTP